MIDPALLRPGRLDIKISIPLPSSSEKVDILKKVLTRANVRAEEGLVETVELEELLDEKEWNAADVASVVNAAFLKGVHDFLRKKKGEKEERKKERKQEEEEEEEEEEEGEEDLEDEYKSITVTKENFVQALQESKPSIAGTSPSDFSGKMLTGSPGRMESPLRKKSPMVKSGGIGQGRTPAGVASRVTLM